MPKPQNVYTTFRTCSLRNPKGFVVAVHCAGTFILQQLDEPRSETFRPQRHFIPSKKASVSKRLQSVSFQCQSRRCRAILRYNIANSLRHQLLEPFFLRERFLSHGFRNCGDCFSPVDVKYALSFYPNALTCRRQRVGRSIQR